MGDPDRRQTDWGEDVPGSMARFGIVLFYIVMAAIWFAAVWFLFVTSGAPLFPTL